MPDANEFAQQRPGYLILFNGHLGTGKTRHAASFPKFYGIGCDPAGFETIRDTPYQKNLVNIEYPLASSKAELKELFRASAKSNERQSIYGCLAHAKELIQAGEVETVILDGFTYFNDAKWFDVQVNEKAVNKDGELDMRAMYNTLHRSMQNFVMADLLPLATRQRVNVIVTCHIQRLSEEQVKNDGERKKDADKKRARGIVLNSDIAPRIEGGFRSKIEGPFRANIYLDKRIDPAKGIVYEAICDLVTAMGTQIWARNSYHLPAKFNVTGKGFYEVLQEYAAMNGKASEARKP